MKKFDRFFLFFIIFDAFVLFSLTKVSGQTKYILYVTYKIPAEVEASNLESRCSNNHAVCIQACQNGDGKIDCQTRCEKASRQCLLGINGVKFWLAACKEGNCETVDDILPLTREEALDIRLNDKFYEISQGYYKQTGTYASVSAGSCTFRRTSDNAEISFNGSNIIGQAISNYNKNPIEAALYAAILNGQDALVKSLLSRGADVNGSGKWGDYHIPLDIAQQMEKWDLVKELITKYNADVNKTGGLGPGGRGGLTILSGAVKKNDMDLVKLIIDHGAEIHRSGSTQGVTPLGIALENNNILMVEFLISQGASVNLGYRYPKDDTYIGQMAAGGNLSLVKILIQNGADINRKNLLGETPLDLAEKNKHKEVADFLRSKGAKNGQ